MDLLYLKQLKTPVLWPQGHTAGFLFLSKNMGDALKRVAVYIDGSNFYHKMKSPDLNIGNLTNFNFRGLAEWLARGCNIISCRYYIGIVRAEEGNEKGQELRREQQKLFAHLISLKQNFVIKRGYIINNNNTYHEKGVDVKLAVDLLVGAYDNIYDVAILISSDTDLIPAIKKVRHLGKEVEYIGFSFKPSTALTAASSSSRLLIKKELEPFVFSN